MSQDDWPTGKQPRVSEEVADDTVADERPKARRGAVDADSAETELVAAATPGGTRRAETRSRPTRATQGRQGHNDWPIRVAEVALALIVLAGAVFLAGHGPSASPTPPPRLNISANLYCPNVTGMAGSISAVADADLKWQPDGGSAVPGSAYFQHDVTTGSTLQGSGSVAGVVQFGSGGQVGAAACTTPAASGYLQTGAANATLILQNVDDQQAILNVALLGTAGEVDPSDLIDLTIAPGTTKQINVGDYASGISPIAVRWQSTVGRVLAWLVTSDSSGLDIATPTTTATQIVVPGVPGGATVQVMITNPATVRIKASIEALTAQGRIPLSGADQVTIEAGSTTSVDVTSALSTDPTALVVSSDQPIAASAWLSHASDTATSHGVLVNESGGVDSFGVTPGHSQVLISNIGTTDTTATVTLGAAAAQTVPVAAGVTVAVAAPQAGAVRVSGTGIVAALVVRGSDDDASGMSVVALAPDTARTGLAPAWIEAQPH